MSRRGLTFCMPFGTRVSMPACQEAKVRCLLHLCKHRPLLCTGQGRPAWDRDNPVHIQSSAQPSLRARMHILDRPKRLYSPASHQVVHRRFVHSREMARRKCWQYILECGWRSEVDFTCLDSATDYASIGWTIALGG